MRGCDRQVPPECGGSGPMVRPVDGRTPNVLAQAAERAPEPRTRPRPARPKAALAPDLAVNPGVNAGSRPAGPPECGFSGPIPPAGRGPGRSQPRPSTRGP